MAAALLGVGVLALLLVVSEGQQSYVNNKQLNCDVTPNITLGFVCNAAAPSCTSYLTFRSTPIYNSPVTIAYLLAADASDIAAANNISDVAPLPADTLVVVPVNCSCSGNGTHYYQQHNASYVLKVVGENYFTVANFTYQALSTCQALMAQNPYDLHHLLPDMKLTVPLRCACPTPTQTAAGFRYLLTYLVRQGNNYESIAAEFSGAGADVQGILDANMLTEDKTVFFFTPILVPLKTQPTKENINSNTAAAPPPPPIPSTKPGGSGGSGSNKSVFIGVGIGAAVFLVLLSAVALFCFFRRKTPKSAEEEALAALPEPPPLSNKLSSFSEGIRSAMESLSIYKIDELEKATNSFAESNRMKGSSSVYRGWFKGDEGVVKVMKGDVSHEIDALRQLNHSRILRLSGFCLHQGSTYLVYEYAENGSVAEWLHNHTKDDSSKHHQQQLQLDWKQRIQIAYDVAEALNYLHNFTNPPYIHKNLTTSNILLDGNMRAKLANFGLARAINTDTDMMTRHVVGAHGYMPPEYIDSGMLSPKLDVFAFGVVMLELLSGREAAVATDHDHDHDHRLLSQSIQEVLTGENVREKLRGFMDPSLREEYPLELAHSMAQLASSCVAHDAHARPPVSDVFLVLSNLRSSSLDWDPSLDTSFTFSE